MDSQTVDNAYSALQQQSQQTAGLLQALASKLDAAATSGDQNARGWQLDLREIALAIRDEEGQATQLLQSIHTLVDNHVQQQAPEPVQYQQPVQQYQPQPQYAPQFQQSGYAQPGYGAGGGGALHRFLGGGFGQAMASGAGFGIGDDLIQSIFNR
ncbi:hypothetical protein [Antrihabitans cavernicola]|uniref:Uncharacterized protein n=1 Tax=Antrihabitans cavernicola TaxID=2495913 RepID=A0A5A7S6S0_9NOCA|nr:hypothetical protein [Spelaeibacter cavernicola]KAA0021194.1 hypothetical protein FOY51_19990 [Spelaeibacter cavernicola]